MDKLKNYDISFSGLKVGKHEFKFDINQEFFDLFDTEKEFSNSKINANAVLDKHSSFMELEIKVSGSLELTCDISNDKFDYPIENEIKVLVKFGDDFDDSDSEIIVLPFNSAEVNVAQLIYEDVMLSVPMKKLSPELAQHPEYEALLEQFSPKEMEEESDTDDEDVEVDPRWEALKNLKNNN